MIVSVDGMTLTVNITRNAVKHINARFQGTTLLINAPMKFPPSELDRATTDLARRLVRRVHAASSMQRRMFSRSHSGLRLEFPRRHASRMPRPFATISPGVELPADAPKHPQGTDALRISCEFLVSFRT
jgi:hypothetical protein